jgi:thioredoxin reductase (NADPH)
MVRGPGLEATMSRYLIERIAALPNVELHTHTEIVAVEGDRAGGLTAATCHNHETGVELHRPLRHLFLFIGADPNAGWLQGCVETDAKGFVTTGADPRLPLQTALPGVFAIGDVRAGSTKRVAAAVGEGAAVVAQIHAFLAQAVTGA